MAIKRVMENSEEEMMETYCAALAVDREFSFRPYFRPYMTFDSLTDHSFQTSSRKNSPDIF
ncbi:MAG: hypothetical protein KKI06_08745, partial [Euryarchaeota archaeon]|nr:hypothetical protein [Euryarchaeota archaeon]